MSIEKKWIYLPEVPDSNRDVLVAHKDFENPCHGYFSRWGKEDKGWINNADDSLLDDDKIYAWRELPILPPLSEGI